MSYVALGQAYESRVEMDPVVITASPDVVEMDPLVITADKPTPSKGGAFPWLALLAAVTYFW